MHKNPIFGPFEEALCISPKIFVAPRLFLHLSFAGEGSKKPPKKLSSSRKLHLLCRSPVTQLHRSRRAQRGGGRDEPRVARSQCPTSPQQLRSSSCAKPLDSKPWKSQICGCTNPTEHPKSHPGSSALLRKGQFVAPVLRPGPFRHRMGCAETQVGLGRANANSGPPSAR